MNRLGFRHDNLRRTMPERAGQPASRVRRGLHALRDRRRAGVAVPRRTARPVRSRDGRARRDGPARRQAPRRQLGGAAPRHAARGTTGCGPGLLLYGIVPPPLAAAISTLRPALSLHEPYRGGEGPAAGRGHRLRPALDARRRTEVDRDGPADAAFTPPGGESLVALGVRVRAACDDLVDESGRGDVVVVSHVSPIKAAMAWALRTDDSVSWRLFVEVASIARDRGGSVGRDRAVVQRTGQLSAGDVSERSAGYVPERKRRLRAERARHHLGRRAAAGGRGRAGRAPGSRRCRRRRRGRRRLVDDLRRACRAIAPAELVGRAADRRGPPGDLGVVDAAHHRVRDADPQRRRVAPDGVARGAARARRARGNTSAARTRR